MANANPQRGKCKADGRYLTPAVLPAMLERGYDKSFSQMDKNVKSANFNHKINDPKINKNAWQGIMFDKNSQTVSLQDGVLLDLGGFAKGLTAFNVEQDFIQSLQNKSQNQKLNSINLLIDAGGDVLMFTNHQIKSKTQNHAWRIEMPSANVDFPIEYFSPFSDDLLSGFAWANEPVSLDLPYLSIWVWWCMGCLWGRTAKSCRYRACILAQMHCLV